MSPKHCSLAFDEALHEFDTLSHLENGFEPELKVLVNTAYAKNPGMKTMSHADIVHVSGKITVSF